MIATAIVQAQSFGTAFTYQGNLSANGIPANGNYYFAFTLYTNATTANQFNAPNNPTIASLAVSNGLFTASIDYGDVFTNG